MSSTQRQRRKEARPREILAAALHLFTTKGFAATRIEEVAQAAGVTKGTVYLYFQSKEALFKTAVRETVLPNLQRVEEAARQEGAARQRLRAALRQWISGMGANRGSLLKLMIAEAGNFPELAQFFQEEISDKMRQILMEVIASGIAQNEFRNFDPAIVIRILTSPILLTDIWHLTCPAMNASLPDTETLIETMLDVVFDGIALRQES